MNTHAFEKKLHSLKARFGLRDSVLAAVVCTSWIVTDHANAVYILTGPEDAAIVLNEEEVREGEMSSQLVYLSSGQSGYDMALTAGQEVTVTHDGSTVTAKARSETVAELLERLHITPSPLEMVAVDLDEDSAELTIASELTYYDQVEEPATYETVRVANPSLPKGTEKVVQEGADGVRTSIYEVVWSGGEEISRQFVEELESTAVNEVVEYGTAVASTRAGVASVSKNTDGSGILTLTDGTTLNFSGVKSMTATAYTAGHGGADYTTATGTLVKVGTVAVDKNVIPLGTKMYIVAADGSVVYGTAVAADTGVRGNIVDLYYDTYQQCINFGRRTCNVYILGDGTAPQRRILKEVPALAGDLFSIALTAAPAGAEAPAGPRWYNPPGCPAGAAGTGDCTSKTAGRRSGRPGCRRSGCPPPSWPPPHQSPGSPQSRRGRRPGWAYRPPSVRR